MNLESVWESGGSGIDIRYGDIDEFLRNHPSHEVERTTEGIAINDIQPNPDHIVELNVNRFQIGGYGTAFLAYDLYSKDQLERRDGTYIGDMYMAGKIPVPQLENESIEGFAGLRINSNILDMSFTVSRPDPYSGTVSGPRVEIAYNADTDKIEELVFTPFDVLNMQGEKEDHYEFDLSEENALALGRMIYEAIGICTEYARVNDLMD